jgi:hypothetical protein
VEDWAKTSERGPDEVDAARADLPSLVLEGEKLEEETEEETAERTRKFSRDESLGRMPIGTSNLNQKLVQMVSQTILFLIEL